MSKMTRRDAIGTAVMGAAGVALAGGAATTAAALEVSRYAVLAGKHTPKPLRFDPARLTGNVL